VKNEQSHSLWGCRRRREPLPKLIYIDFAEFREAPAPHTNFRLNGRRGNLHFCAKWAVLARAFSLPGFYMRLRTTRLASLRPAAAAERTKDDDAARVWIKVYLVIGRARGVAWDILGAGLTFIRRQRIKYKAARRKCFWEFSCGLSIYDVATQLFFVIKYTWRGEGRLVR
jgi:hypothetical protein